MQWHSIARNKYAHFEPFVSSAFDSGESELTGATNLMAYYGLEHSYSKFSGKKVKEQLSSFLPNLPGVIDGPGQIVSSARTIRKLALVMVNSMPVARSVSLFRFFQENSSLRSIIEKPPIGGKELLPLSNVQLAGFRLHPGPLPEQYRYLNTTPARKHKNKYKKHRHKDSNVGNEPLSQTDASVELHEKKHKKQKRHEDEKSERKKRKKEKKRKKQRHSPEPPGAQTPHLTQIF